jgi:hypothetical protein
MNKRPILHLQAKARNFKEGDDNILVLSTRLENQMSLSRK